MSIVSIDHFPYPYRISGEFPEFAELRGPTWSLSSANRKPRSIFSILLIHYLEGINMPRFNAKIVCHALISVNDGIDPSEFIFHDNDFMAEPKNANGTVIALKPEQVTIMKPGYMKQTNLNHLDRYMHFAFRGAQICVDTKERTVISSKKAKAEEMIGPKENKMWPLNVETSN